MLPGRPWSNFVENNVAPILSTVMAYDPRFGPAAQTPQQRAYVLAQLQAVYPRLKTKASAYAKELYARYVAGELSWTDVRSALNAAHG